MTRTFFRVVWALFGSLLAANSANAQANSRLVSPTGVDVGDCSVNPCATIQFALNVAMPGDTIRVAAGTYDETLIVRTNGLTLQGAGPAVTAIRGTQFGNVVTTYIDNSTAIARFTVEGFTITSVDVTAPASTGISLDAPTLFGDGDWIIRGNVIRDTGTGIAMGFVYAAALIENNVIANNGGHGIYNLRHSRVTIRNNTIVGNGFVGYREEYGPPVQSAFVNNIVAFNGSRIATSFHPTGFEAASPGYFIAFNNMFANAFGDYGQFEGNGTPALPLIPSPGTGEISSDPMFVDAANGDFHVAPGSPSIDAGTNDNAPAIDAEGNPRPVDGDGDGTPIVDMGAFESPEATDTVPPDVFAAVRPPFARSIGHKMMSFLVWGTVTDNTTVNATSGTYAVTDEYGEIEPQGTFTVGADGGYEFPVLLEAWRRGSDRDGRQYLITVTVDDTAGNTGIASARVIVLHDSRNRKD